MNIEEYISSGVIEAYVLGMATQAESIELQRLCVAYPEVRQALLDAQQLLEAEALSSAIPPPVEMKERIWNEINGNPGIKEPPGITLNMPGSSKNIWRWIAAASVIMLITSVIYFKYSFDRLREENRIAIEKLESEAEVREASVISLKSQIAIVSDTAFKKVSLPGTEAHKESLATIYWDSNTSSVYLQLNNMPSPKVGKQYQLWAIVEGKPVDLGVFNSKTDQLQIQKMKNTSKAEMFAITLEKEGGSTEPTMSEMYVAGKI